MELFFKDEALKKLKKISKADRNKIIRKLQVLKKEPLYGKRLDGKLAGLYSIRAWPLRIIYEFDNIYQHIIIHTIDYRGNVYKN